MKILFIIAVKGHGRGGHFHSLDHISRSIGSKLSVGIISVGPGSSEIIQDNPYFLKHINFNGIGFIRLHKELSSIFRTFEPNVLHFFDVDAHNLVTPFVHPKKFGFVVNLCGGPNPQEYPMVDNLVLFSNENAKWFKKKAKFNATYKVVIPNRVTRIELLADKKIKKDSTVFTFMRIARISEFHKKSIFDAIDLVDKLKELQLSVKLIVLGTVQDTLVLKELHGKIENKSYITLLTDDDYTKRASKMLYLADAVIATGRGIMEASSLALPILTPASNSRLPILINSTNFEKFFGTNFSARNWARPDDLKNNLKLVERLVQDKNFNIRMSKYSLRLFDDFFNVENGVDKYLQVYKRSMNVPKVSKRFSDLMLKLRTFYRMYKKT